MSSNGSSRWSNSLVWTYAIGGAFYHLLGAGLFGFAHTLPQVNYYTHGSQVTVSHGHLAFFGAYAMLNIMVFYYAMPQLKGLKNFAEGRGKFGFWTMTSAMFCIGLTFGVAGVLQAYSGAGSWAWDSWRRRSRCAYGSWSHLSAASPF